MRKKISIIIPVLNESGDINNTIEHLNGLITSTNVPAEIIVVDGDPQGKTIAVLRDKNTITTTSKTGRASQMNKGAALATGKIFLFLHADTRLPDESLKLVAAACARQARGAGAFD